MPGTLSISLKKLKHHLKIASKQLRVFTNDFQATVIGKKRLEMVEIPEYMILVQCLSQINLTKINLSCVFNRDDAHQIDLTVPIIRNHDHPAKLIQVSDDGVLIPGSFKYRIYAVKKCRHCLTVWNRVNAAKGKLPIHSIHIFLDSIMSLAHYINGTGHRLLSAYFILACVLHLHSNKMARNPAASTLNAFHGLVKAVQKHGAKKTFQMILTLGQPKVGELVGTDSHKNEYYENRMDYHGRDRWVLFNKWNYDASQVPPEWHQWLHRMTDDAPTTSKNLSASFFTPPHMENLTGTRGAFKTYNTVAPKMESWKPIVKTRIA